MLLVAALAALLAKVRRTHCTVARSRQPAVALCLPEKQEHWPRSFRAVSGGVAAASTGRTRRCRCTAPVASGSLPVPHRIKSAAHWRR